VGSASGQICCRCLTMSASFASPCFCLSRRRGLAPAVFVKLTAAALCCCGAIRKSAYAVVMIEKPAYRGDEAIIERLGQCRVGRLCRAGNRWRLRASGCRCVAHLIPNITTTFLVEFEVPHDSMRVLLLIGLSCTSCRHFSGKPVNFSRGVVEVNMSDKNNVPGQAYL
jgi:hypothetical protein